MLLFSVTIAALLALLVEGGLLRRRREKLKYRILVTGTRGKTTLVREIAEMCREAGLSTLAKTTGDEPVVILPNGEVKLLKRRGPSRIQEQVRLLFAAARTGAEVMVVESMAITPDLLKAEVQLLDPDLVLLTNIRDDHRETLGTSRHEQTYSYLDALPESVPVLTADAGTVDLLQEIKQQNRIEFIAAAGSALASSASPTQHDFLLKEAVWHKLVLGGLLEGAMPQQEIGAESGFPRMETFVTEAGVVRLLDGFSINDPDSLQLAWEEWQSLPECDRPWTVLFATRSDRPLRTVALVEFLASQTNIKRIYVLGTHRTLARTMLTQKGIKVVGDAGYDRMPVDGIIESLVSRIEPGGVLVGVGNSRGVGNELRNWIAGMRS